jgi:hypothetical protein
MQIALFPRPERFADDGWLLPLGTPTIATTAPVWSYNGQVDRPGPYYLIQHWPERFPTIASVSGDSNHRHYCAVWSYNGQVDRPETNYLNTALSGKRGVRPLSPQMKPKSIILKLVRHTLQANEVGALSGPSSCAGCHKQEIEL